tara:strand:- start:12947 stop:13381 length:435 start_codon:yes stop_codon:yes gene_type:complete
MMSKILVINGPNLNFLGKRNPDIYGADTLTEVEDKIKTSVKEKDIELVFFQSNHEGELVDIIQQHHGAVDGIAINAGALTHYGYSLKDALIDAAVPVVEVHVGNPYGREEWRRHSVIADIAIGIVSGFGWRSYKLAIDALIEHQ